ncbi:hypothetical protein C8J57DRAFT_356626 [Mycena rebaudengoi]|nr:hypothetical protein C8J57DRAFT_356626 [Mycena rebaudengoi]
MCLCRFYATTVLVTRTASFSAIAIDTDYFFSYYSTELAPEPFSSLLILLRTARLEETGTWIQHDMVSTVLMFILAISHLRFDLRRIMNAILHSPFHAKSVAVVNTLSQPCPTF